MVYPLYCLVYLIYSVYPLYLVYPTLHNFIQRNLNSGSNPARGISEIHDGEDLWYWSQLEMRLNAFRQWTIPQKQFIIIILIFIELYSIFSPESRLFDCVLWQEFDFLRVYFLTGNSLYIEHFWRKPESQFLKKSYRELITKYLVSYNQWQNILSKVRKSSKIGQDQKTLITAFA